MSSVSPITPDEHNGEDDNKVCERLGCQEKAIEGLDLPFGEFGSTLFYLCKECKRMIENMESR